MIGKVILYAAILIAAVTAAGGVISLSRQGSVKLSAAAVGIVLSAACMLLAAIGAQKGAVFVRPDGDPGECVRLFFDALEAGDHYSAYACLDNYSSLGLENTPDTEIGKLIYSALRESYSYTMDANAKVDKLSAVQPVSFTYLRIPDMEEEIRTEGESILGEIVGGRPRSEVFDAEGRLLPAVSDEVFKTAVTNVLSHVQDFYTTDSLNITLTYKGGKWSLSADQALLSAVTGGTAG